MCLDTLLNWLSPWRLVDAVFNDANASFKTYRISNNRSDLDAALKSYALAYGRSNEAHDKYPTIITNYAISLYAFNQRFGGETGRFEDVNRLFTQALTILEGKIPRSISYPNLLIRMGTAYTTQYRQTKTPRDIQLAIEKFNRVRTIDDMPIPNDIRRKALIGLSFALWTQCELDPGRGEDSDLDDAKTHLRESLKLSKGKPREQAECYEHLASTYDVVYRRHKERSEELNSAIEFNIKALDCGRYEAPIVFNLAKQYLARYVETQPRAEGDLDLAENRANEVIQQAQQGKAPPGLGPQARELLGKIDQYRRRGDTMLSTASADSQNQRSDGMPSMVSVDPQNDAGLRA